MAKFVKISDPDGYTQWVNPDHVLRVHPERTGNGSILTTSKDSLHLWTALSADEAAALLSGAATE